MSYHSFVKSRPEKLPEKIDFVSVLKTLGSDAAKIKEALDYELKTRRPCRIKDPHYWLYTETSWVLAFKISGEWEFKRCSGNFFDEVRILPTWIKSVFVFRSDGLFIRHYERVFDFFKTKCFSILEFSQEDREALFKELKRPMRQKIVA